MDIFANFAVNEDAEEQGVWCPLGDVEFLIARQNNTRWSRMLTLQMEKNREILEAKKTEEDRDLAEKISKKIFLEVTSKSILLGWRGRDLGDGKVGVLKYAGKEVGEYSVDMAQKMLSHRDFMNWVSNESTKLANFLISAQEEDEKNSETSSTGSSSGEVSLTT